MEEGTNHQRNRWMDRRDGLVPSRAETVGSQTRDGTSLSPTKKLSQGAGARWRRARRVFEIAVAAYEEAIRGRLGIPPDSAAFLRGCGRWLSAYDGASLFDGIEWADRGGVAGGASLGAHLRGAVPGEDGIAAQWLAAERGEAQRSGCRGGASGLAHAGSAGFARGLV